MNARPTIDDPRWAALAFLGLAVLLELPLLLHPHALPLEINTRHHMSLIGQIALERYEPGCVMPGDGLLAWPVVAMAAPMSALTGPVAAYHLATVAWLAASGAAGWLLGRALSLSPWAALALGLSVEGASLWLDYLNGGRIEHLVAPFVALCVAGMARDDRRGAWMAAAGLAAAALASPYQSIPVGILLLSLGATRGARGMLRALGASALAAVPVLLMWAGEAAKGRDPMQQEMPIGVRELLWAGLDPPLERLSDAFQPPAALSLHALADAAAPNDEQLLGAVLLLAGIAGLWRARRERLYLGCLLAIGGCTLLALGQQLRWTADSAPLAWLPWAWLRLLPGLAAMTNSARFLTVPVVLLALGLARLVHALPPAARPLAALLLPALLLTESLLCTPGPLPMRTATLRDGILPAAAAQDHAPLLIWPPLDVVGPGVPEVVGLHLNRAVLVWSGIDRCGQRSSAQGYAAWGAAQGASQMLEITARHPEQPGEPPPLPLPAGARLIDQGSGARLWSLP